MQLSYLIFQFSDVLVRIRFIKLPLNFSFFFLFWLKKIILFKLFTDILYLKSYFNQLHIFVMNRSYLQTPSSTLQQVQITAGN